MAERIGRIRDSAPANDLVIRTTLQEWTTDGAVKTETRMPVYDGLMAVMGLRTPIRAVNIGQRKGSDVTSGHYVCYRRPALADLARDCNNDLALMQERRELWTLYDDSLNVVD
ncbi:hypothetical protein TI39_contig337g00012 [Zymoseptoria brevis]|uniref:Uncharacterized protein n=1 Tax=Zymoseptoria brevis TaxID=1047168 RepID=A0A0F4GTA0_9PEZI|nr:hypothetical protein TI39_contig337g00012 [Zymoseptoria brevis]